MSGHYGIANELGEPSSAELQRLLTLAREQGVDTIDTAAAYGDAETTLGHAGTSDFSMVSKLSPQTAPREVTAAVERSLARLRRDELNGLLIHHVELPVAAEVLDAMRQDPRVQRVGVSVYRPEEVEWLLEQGVRLDLIQAPFSVLDQRFAALFPHLASAGVEVHARSVFLQGLPFLDEGRLGERFMTARPVLRRLRRLAEAEDVPLSALLLGFVAAEPAVTKIVVGIEAAWQLQANLDALQADLGAEVHGRLQELAIEDENILLPSRWG